MLVALIKAALALAGIGTAVKLLSSSRDEEVPPTQAFLVIGNVRVCVADAREG